MGQSLRQGNAASRDRAATTRPATKAIDKDVSAAPIGRVAIGPETTSESLKASDDRGAGQAVVALVQLQVHSLARGGCGPELFSSQGSSIESRDRAPAAERMTQEIGIANVVGDRDGDSRKWSPRQ